MKLLEPLTIRGHDVASRVMFGPIETNLGRRRAFSAAHTALYVRRASGGAGVIVTEIASVHPSDWPYERAPLAADCGPGWREIANEIAKTTANETAHETAHETANDTTNETSHEFSAATTSRCLVLAGLGHSGGQGTSHWSQGVMWAPSPVPEVATREVPKIMEQRDIDDVVAGFASAACLAIESGMDGVEINAGQFSLLRQFISGLTNMRSDGYGSDRLRFAREVIAAVRSVLGEQGVLALRLSCDEMAPWAGLTPEMAVAVAVDLVSCGVDLLTVVRGSIYTSAATQPDMHVEPGFNIGLTRQIRDGLRAQGLTTPVVVQGSIVDVGQAEWTLTDGVADLVEMTRAQLADADLVRKLRSMQPTSIRPCLLCNQTCKVRDNRNPIITCVMDPRTGHELDDPEVVSTAISPVSAAVSAATGIRSLTVVGAGVAGLEAARVAALNGWTVTVRERTNRIGGVVRTAAKASGRDRLALSVDWLEAACRELGVSFELNAVVSTDQLQETPTIVATGALPQAVPFVVGPDAIVIHDVDALNDLAALPDGPLVVWDPIGGPIAIALAETLAELGRTVTLITPDLLVGEKLSLSGDLAPAQNRLHGKGITLVKRAILRRVDSSTVTVEDRFSAASTTISAAAVLIGGQRVPDTSVDPHELLPQVGDRVAPRTILEAILEGRRAAQALR